MKLFARAARLLVPGAIACCTAALAQQSADAPKTVAPTSNATPQPDYTLAWNVAGVSDYRYRGISQTRLNPTLQGGIDFSHESGVYVGIWASGIKWIRDAGGDARVEADFYGGYKRGFGDFGYDVGVLRYQYSRNHLEPSANTTEIYGSVGWRMLNLKYSHSVTNLFGFADSKNSGYLDLSATFDIGNGFSLVPHVGHQRVAHHGDFSYTDYSIGITKELYGLNLSAAIVGTSTRAYRAPDGRDLGRTALVLGVKKVF